MNIATRVIGLVAIIGVVAATSVVADDSATDTTDEYSWLEEVRGEKPVAWVKEHDTTTMSEFKNDSNYVNFLQQGSAIMNSKARIPYGSIMGKYVYNFWQDADHVRGVLRRTTLEDYMKPEPNWEVVLDVDQLNKTEGKSWVYKGATELPPTYTRALVYLSDGGKDASYVREYDYETKSFIDGGFSLPEAKSSISWFDSNTVIVGTNFGPGTQTSSGYPRVIKMWKRGLPLSEATTMLEGDSTDVSVGGGVDFREDGNHFVVYRSISFWESKKWLVDANLQKTEIPLPNDATIRGYFREHLIAGLQSDWLGIPEGSLIAIQIADLGAADLKSKIKVIYSPDDKSTLTGVTLLKDYLIVSMLRNVKGKLVWYALDGTGENERWVSGDIALPEFGSVGVSTADDRSNTFMVNYQDFLNPSKLYLLEDPKAAPKEIKSLPSFFDASELQVQQFEATSADGTAIPYFLVSKKSTALDGTNPTLLYGYGGFRASETPFYSGTFGKFWMERGGVLALANIRGGGEFGPRWHKAALLKNRQKAFDDFIAVGEDLIKRKFTSPRHLGIEGGSNGGLLVGAAFTQRPDLFNAVVCQVPLLDMLRYSKLPPGASWMGEYGDPDSPEMRPIIAKYSPYQNLKQGVKYPQVLFVTSTADDRVHPSHARKTAAKMEGFGNKVYYFEETEGGHAASADNTQRARRVALEFAYLWKMLGK